MTPTISAEELCAITGLTDRRHRQLADKGFFPPPIESQYQERATLGGLIKYYKGLSKADGDAKGQEELLTIKANRRLAELKLRKAQRAVIPTKAVAETWEAIITTARQRILSLPPKLVGGLQTCGTQAEQQAFMQREVDDLLTELSKEPTYKFNETEDAEENEDDAPEHPVKRQDAEE